MLVNMDALVRLSGDRIKAVIHYYGYARQDRKTGPRTPISATLVANLITEAGADRVLTLDLHAGQIQGFFDIPTDNLYAVPLLARDVKERNDTKNVTVVSPRSEEHTSELQSLMRISYAVFCLKKKKKK